MDQRILRFCAGRFRALSQAVTTWHGEGEARGKGGKSTPRAKANKSPSRDQGKSKTNAPRKTYNSRDSLVVTHPTTNLPI